MTQEEFYKSAPVKSIEIEDVSIGLRQFGKGKNIIFIHGFPTHGYTWRKILPQLSNHYTCNVVDLPGLGDSKWSNKTDFNSKAQARYVIKLLKKEGIDKCSLVAHDSGATVARIIAIDVPEMIEKLILINTEIPNHRPPWIPFYQKTGLLPMVPLLLRTALSQKLFVKSSMGFKEAYSDKSMLDNEDNLNPYLRPIIESNNKAIGALSYLKGIDWKIVDEFEKTHQQITAKTLFVWGEDDKTFPIEIGKEMVEQFSGSCIFKTIKMTSLLPHEERSEEVGGIIMNFLKERI